MSDTTGTSDAYLYRERIDERDAVDALLVRVLWKLDIDLVKRIARIAQERIAEDAFVRGLGGDDER